METLIACPICQSPDLRPFQDVIDYFGQQESFTLQVCNECTTVLTNPRPEEKNIVTYYKSNSYVSHGASKGIIFDSIYKLLQQVNLKNKLKLIQTTSSGRQLLDYGCGSGSFLEYMHNRNYQVQGVEPDQEAKQQVTPQIAVSADIESIEANKFDVITAFHVLEHVHQLERTLNAIKNRLRIGGTLYLALPNLNAYDAQHYQDYWAGYDVPRHLYHFTQQSIKHLAQRFGLELTGIKPMKLDSYYVSLLSEQYKKSNFAPVKAMWHGYRSNQLAKRTGEYSSLIYVLQKVEQ